MPAKRPASSNSSSDSDSDHEAKRQKTEHGIFTGLAIFVIQTKLEPSELDLLYSLAESNGADVQSTIEKADVIVTRISMRKRLERHLKWELAKQKAIVTPAWITQGVAASQRLPCGDYAAVCCLEECTVEHCPNHGPQASGSGSKSPPPPSPKNISHTSRFAVQRFSPLTCPNQALLVQLAVIRDARALEGEERSAMSYSRSMAAIKAYPHLIKSPEQVADLPFLGPKLLTMVREYIRTGSISEYSRMSNASRHQCLNLFTRIHGIGSNTARKLYDSGCRTYEDLDRTYGAELGRVAMEEGETAGIRQMLELREELSITIPREEVEEIGRVVAQELDAIESGCKQTICGGYRRGKPQSNDVDIVFTNPQHGREHNLGKKLVDRLHQKGLVTHILPVSSFRSSNSHSASLGASKPDHSHGDRLYTSLTVFRLPDGLHRRVDLIYAPADKYWTAVVGWTGSTLFERDLRLWAKEKMGLKFDSSGITRRRDTKSLFPTSERAVFEMMGLEWINPTLRNADL